MKSLFERMQSAISYVENNKRKIESAAKTLREKNESIKNATESGVVKHVEKIKIDGSVCAIDAGFVSSSSHEIDIFIARAVGVVFNYSDATLSSWCYYPLSSPEPEIDIRTAMDEGSARVYGSLFRLHQELDVALGCVSKFKPDVLLIDGSLTIHPADRPSNENKEIFNFYEKIVAMYKELYEACEQQKCLLIGISKDSRAKRFSSLIGESWPDTLFLDYLLNESERTVSLRYYDKDNPPPKGLEGWADKIKLFYLKCVRNDYPIRVEFISDDGDLVASTVLSLAAINESYAYPAALIEADLRAALDQKEVDLLLNAFFNQTKALRSKARPFR
jgi:hypothetical protein